MLAPKILIGVVWLLPLSAAASTQHSEPVVTIRDALRVLDEARGSYARPIGNPADWFPQDSMPAEAVVRHQTGAVVIQLDLDPQGKVTGCNVKESSDYPLLDTAACDRATRFGRFQPAINAKGDRVSSSFTLPRLRYVLSKDNPSWAAVEGGRRQVYNTTIQLQVDKLGTVTACRSLNKDASDAGACAGYSVGTAMPQVFKADRVSTVTISKIVVVDKDGDQ